MSDPDLSRTLVVGLGVTGRSVARALTSRGFQVLLADDRPDAVRDVGERFGTEVADSTDIAILERLITASTAVVPSPGVPRHHDVYGLSDSIGRPVLSELDLAAGWDSRPVAAITGTNGKTTVTTLVTTMLRRSGILAEAAGNTDTPLVDAIDARSPRPEAFVVEASSFRLERTERFAPRVAAWLNLAPDHLDWHGDLDSYAAAKARIWAHQGSDDVAVAPFDDPSIQPYLEGVRSHVVTFGGLDAPGADVGVRGDMLVAHGDAIVAVADIKRRRPHDLENAAASVAIALAMGADRHAIADELREFSGLPHRLQAVATIDGVTFHNDSKATAPHATLAALGGFEAAVLIAGGRNKDLDLSELALAAPRLSAVIVIGEAAEELAATFEGLVPVERADTMEAAVLAGLRLATDAGGSDVILSPACASYDWYRSYEERGNHYRDIVTELATRHRRETTGT